MQLIELDASGWAKPLDFYLALLPQLGAPEWHGLNLDALYDSLLGDINAVEPPFSVTIRNIDRLPAEMADFMMRVATVFADARQDHGVDVTLQLI
ncbi:barstar family protein [Sphingobium yanoikuyae]|uniref:Barstar family protein n=1 Tax=Sphingobium yanoikuyae TaxID=13690 RepID=A0AA43BD82_SPHYA|nr:barstar family protein [Sphingobium yanoikuyae]MDH2134070.1 barstar family protein [Sphingobium yanoikuyae]MDH2151454.1 barstar family protein [Sphingobium yanoikuyae]MDH2169254.1 barstar family protein [Sphingobium yanoikuyae]